MLLELGDVQPPGRAGRSRRSSAFESAAEIARELDDAELLARAAIGYEDACWRPGMRPGAVGLLEEAAAALGDAAVRAARRSARRAARALDMQGDARAGAIVARRAIALARRLGDRAGLATVLDALLLVARGDLARGDPRDAHRGAGDGRGARRHRDPGRGDLVARAGVRGRSATSTSRAREVVSLLEIAQMTAQPFMLHVAEHYGSAIALADGRLEEAEAMAERS